jgi:multiple antibiotic resistance protein
MNYELSWGDIFILFFLTLGPLKAILPFARVTRGTELAFRRTVARRAVTIATPSLSPWPCWGRSF